jgi:hypothetical protein
MSAEYEKPEFIFLKQEDVATCGGGDMRLALADVERAFVMKAKNEIIQPIKTRLEFFNEDKTARDTASRCQSILGVISREPESNGRPNQC